MVATETMKRMGASAAGFYRAADWERAAQILDFSPELVRRLKTPQIECVSRHELASDTGSVVLLHIAKMSPSCEATFVKVAVGTGSSSFNVAAVAQEIQLLAALGGSDSAGAAVGLQIPSSSIGEQALWELSRECAPLIARVVGSDAFLLADDVRSAAFARWLSEAAARLGNKLRMPAIPPEEYCAQIEELRAEAIVVLAALALGEIGKKKKGSKVSIIGNGPVARECMRRLHEAGAGIVAVADESGSVIDGAGLQVPEILQHFGSGGLAVEYPGAKHGLHSEALVFPADLLLLCADGSEIVQDNAAPRIIVDAFGTCLDSGEAEHLGEHGVTIIDGRMIGTSLIFSECAGDSGRFGKQRHAIMSADLAELWENVRTIAGSYRLPRHIAALVLALQRLAGRARSARP